MIYIAIGLIVGLWYFYNAGDNRDSQRFYTYLNKSSYQVHIIWFVIGGFFIGGVLFLLSR